MRTTTSKLVKSFREVFKEPAHAGFFLPVNPVPASRPRVSKWGTYYGKTYNAWRKDAAKALKEYREFCDKTEGRLYVVVECVVLKPKTSKREYPRGDVDNYAKAPLDAITSHTDIWNDDDQIVALLVTKQFTTEPKEAGNWITIYTDE